MDKMHSNPQLISYRTLRRCVGFIGILLPFVLFAGALLSARDKTVQPSISDYYFTTMGDVFVGALFAVALFLFCYKGPEKKDSIVANVAGLFAVIVALFPTTPSAGHDHHAGLLAHTHLTGIVHYTAAASLFLTLASFSLFLFTIKDAHPTTMKLRRNKIYITCGVIMLCCVGMIPVFAYWPQLRDLARGRATFILETIALWAFGVSWLIKGETLFAD